jgi:uncharacterized protein with HEPN domain
MSRHDDRVSLRQMLDHVEKAVLLAEERTRADLGTRNHFIHGSYDVDDDILWNIATVDFPPLAVQIRTLLQKRGWA